MALPATISIQGTTVTLATTAWTSNVLGLSIDGIERGVKPVTTISTTGFMQFKPGSLVNPGTLQVRFFLDPNNIPPITADAETITLQFPAPLGETTGATLSGTGFISNYNVDGNEGDEAEMSGEFTWTWDGDVGPTWTDSIP